jgi:arabinose-5-phosphate isomerase
MAIKFVLFDFDGIFTDGKCYFDSRNNVIKYYNVKDGMALKILRDNNIITGLISSYSTNKDINFCNLTTDKEIIDHLKFDYKFIGNCNKLDILNNWLEELDMNYENVAYIGDDINDMEIMAKCGLSSCPSDAVPKCKEIVDFICEKTGGNGCVREFVERVVNTSQKLSIISEIKKEFLYQINNFDLDGINKLAAIIMNMNGNIYFCGVGKSGNIAKHCCDLLKCISLPAFNFDVLNSTHGDIGTLTDKDMVLMFSNSGNTLELVNIISLFKNIGTKVIGICCNDDSKFKQLSDFTIITPFMKEISGEIDKIPTNSYMSHLIFSNILVSILKKYISIDKYKKNHVSGIIGKQLLKVKDVLIKEYPKIILDDDNEIDINIVLLEMTKLNIGCCFFLNSCNNLKGILTDGDIRRLLLGNNILRNINIDNINKTFYYTENDDIYLSDIPNKYSFIPLINKNKILGIFRH